MQTPACDHWAAEVLALEGSITVNTPDKRSISLSIGDCIKPGETALIANGRATLRLPNQTYIRAIPYERNAEEQTITEIHFKEVATNPLVKLWKGLLYFISRTPQRFDVETPYINAYIDGTEFMVSSIGEAESTTEEKALSQVEVYEGLVNVAHKGDLTQSSDSPVAISPGEGIKANLTSMNTYPIVDMKQSIAWALYYPPITSLPSEKQSPWLTSTITELYQQANFSSIQKQLKAIPELQQDLQYHLLMASIALHLGQTKKAEFHLQHIESRPNTLESNETLSKTTFETTFKNAMGLKALMYLIQGQTAKTQKIFELHPPATIAQWISYSYWQQSQHKLPKAFEAAEKAKSLITSTENTKLTDALVLSRYGELAYMLGRTSIARTSLNQALSLNPNFGRTYSTQGFIELKSLHLAEASKLFNNASSLMPTDPIPYVGLALIDIRENRLDEGRKKLEIAAVLDPGQSTIRSYLGKAYYEEGRSSEATLQFELAQRLDPEDPTPWYYQAYLDQTLRQPKAALENYQKSLEKNHQRGAYRSQNHLDADFATRTSNVADVYQELNFDNYAQSLATKAINHAPTEYSSHQLLSQSYAQDSRKDSARERETYLAQAYQPLTAYPINPLMSEVDLITLKGAGPAELGTNEYHSFFHREDHHAQLSATKGTQNTDAYLLQLSGLEKSVAYSLGHYHYNSDGFDDNDEVEYDISTAFLQHQVNERFSWHLELKHREESFGDIANNIGEEINTTGNEFTDNRTNIFRLGARTKLSADSDFLVSLGSRRSDENFSGEQTTTNINGSVDLNVDTTSEQKADSAELAYLHNTHRWKFQSGINLSQFSLTDSTLSVVQLTLPPGPIPLPPPPPIISNSVTDADIRISGAYAYSLHPIQNTSEITLGLGYTTIAPSASSDFFSEKEFWLPKLGYLWQPIKGFSLALSHFESVATNESLSFINEPSQIAGINQVFDDDFLEKSTNTGFQITHQLNTTQVLGLEAMHRQLEAQKIGILAVDGTTFTVDEQTSIQQGKLYYSWLIGKHSLRFEREFHQWELDEEDNSAQIVSGLTEHKSKIGWQYQRLQSWLLETDITHVSQEITTANLDDASSSKDEHDFISVDISARYFFGRQHNIALKINNILDEDIFYDRNSLEDNSPKHHQYSNERSALLQLNLSF